MGDDLKPTILVVDDLEQNVYYLEEVMKPLNVNVIRALSGKEALIKIQGKELALALIDVQMPGMNGLELATIISKERGQDIVPMIFITAYVYNEFHLEKYYETGIIDFIIKPFQRTILLSKIKILLELDRQKRRIRESERMYRTLLNASPEGIIIMDIHGKIQEISDMASKIFGISAKNDFIGKNIRSLFPIEEHPRLQEVIDKTLKNNLTRDVEFILTKADQSQFISEISTTLIFPGEGVPGAFMTIIRDISSRKNMEQQLIHTERMASLGEMAAGIAHEINQPLNTISLGIENLLNEIENNKDIDDSYLRGKSDKIFDNISRIDYIVDHIRTFSRSSDGDVLSGFNLNNSIRDGIAMISGQFAHKGIEMIVHLDDTIPPVMGNTYKFEQIIINLLLNAKDALEEKQQSQKVELHKIIEIVSHHNSRLIYVEVKDNGIGIKAELLEKIMLPFFTTKEAGKGTGLGLSIVFGIVKEMHGNIKIKSDYLSGTTIQIVIPVQPGFKE